MHFKIEVFFIQAGIFNGVLMLNGVAVNVAAGLNLTQVVAAINANTALTGVTASDVSGQLKLTPDTNQSVNTVSPYIDLSQSYGSSTSHTVFLREYDANGKITGGLVSGADGGMATWADIKANAEKIGITLNDYDVLDIPEVRMFSAASTAAGGVYLDGSNQAWLVTRHLTTGAVCVYHEMVETAVRALEGSNIPVAAVSTGFPAGLSSYRTRIMEIGDSVKAGAKEIDIVISRRHVLTQNWQALYDEMREMRAACQRELDGVKARSADTSVLQTARRWLHRDNDKVPAEVKPQLAQALAEHPVLEKMVTMREELRALWSSTNASREQLALDLQAWCKRAEDSGIAALRDFSVKLRSAHA